MLIPLTALRLRLIDGWQHCWKWSSIRFLMVGGAIQTGLLAFPDKLLQYVPNWVLSALSVFALACVIAAGIGRVTTVEPKDQNHV